MLYLKQGNILQVRAQAVVIPSNNQLLAGPGLSEQAYKFFGEKELHQACQNYLKKKKETLVPYTKVVSTETKKNPYFQYVFHAIVPIFDDAKSEFSESQMMRLLENILNEVKYLNIKSISIPALGCGMNLYPIDSFLIAFAGVFSENLSKFQHVEFNLVLYDQQSFDQASIILENIINQPPQHQVPQQQYQPPQKTSEQGNIWQNDKLKNYKEKEQEELKQKKIFKFGTFTDSEINKNSNQQQPFRFATQNHNQAMQFTRNPQQNKNFQEENNQQNLYQYQEQKIDTHNSQKQSLQRPQDYQYDKNDDNYQQQNQYDYGQKREQDFQQYQPSQQQSPPPQQSQQDQYQNHKQPFTNKVYKEHEYNMNSQIRKKQEPPKEDLQVVTQGDLYLQKSETYAPVYPDVTQYPPGDFIQSDQKGSSISKNNAKLPFKYIYLHITIDENSAITSESLLMNLLLNLCKQIYYMHKLIYEKPENKIKSGANCLLTYKVEREISEIINFASPEMMFQSQYIANSSDMFSLGLVIYKLIFKKNALPNDQQQYKQILENKQISFQRPRFQYSQDIQVILDKLLTDETNQRLMPYQIVQKLLTLSKDEDLQQEWQNYLSEMTKFYQHESIMHQIKQNLKQIVEIANREGAVQQLKVGSEVQVQEGPESVIVFQKETLLQQKLEESRKDISQISLKQNQDDSNNTLYSLLHADQNKQLQKQAMEMNDFSQCQIKCVVIPINKKNPESTMPDFLKGDSKFDSQFRGLLDFARMEQEYFIQTFKCQVPIFGCQQVIFVFCPDENSNDGRRIRLQRCYLDILLYAFKCLKVESICMCLDNIFSLLISDKSNLPLENYDIQAIFNSACAEMKPDMIKNDQIKFQGQDWIIARLQTPKLVLGKLSIVVEYRDIVNLKGIDAIVNAANKELNQGAGVCGAIFKACGQYELRNEIDGYFRQQGRRSVDVSEVVVTDSYNLKAQKGAKYIFHAVGPIYREQDHMMCVNQLQKCLLNILKQCEELSIESIAIPAISTGIYGFPKQLCAEIFKKTFLTCSFKKLLHVYLVTLDSDTHNIFQFVFRDGQYKEMIYSQIENIPTTECLVLPINIKELNTGITKKVFTLGGNHLKNQVEFMVKSSQYPILSQNSIFTCQSFNLKFKGVYNVMFVSGPQKDVVKNLNYLLYGVFNEILDTAFNIKKFQSITVVFMAILQQCLPEEQIETYSGMKSIKIFMDSIRDFQQNHNGMIGKITILSNMSEFINECKEFFIQ